ncbi:MAG: hybrid sensor histidine kinase/response regulator, partial [Pyrinomonadaceae bacterium]
AVTDGRAALGAARERVPDLVLTDVMMPRLDGFGLLRELRADERTKTVPVILLSARAGEESRVEGLEAGADDYLVKPFGARELLARVESHLKLQRVRREAERAVRESEERFRHMADHAPVMVWVTEPDATCTYLSKSWYEFTGQTPETGLGFGWLDATHPDDRDSSGEIFRRANERREAFRLEYRLRRRDGEYRWAIDAAAPRFSPEGAFLGYVGSVIDITERRQAEAEREAVLDREQSLREQAEAANRLKDEFLATVSHEIRTPLTAILGWANILRTNSFDDATAARALETIERNARAQTQIIDDLLEVSRIITGKLRINVHPVGLAPVVEAAVDVVRPAAAAKGIRIETRLDPATGVVAGDPDRLQQAVWNLLSNAVKFTPSGGRVEVRLERSGDHIETTVADTGEGISPEFLPYVFDRFRQADSTTTRAHGGLGLGLAIVRHLVEAHGGTVHVASGGKGRGATFTIRLPLAAALAVSSHWDGTERRARQTGEAARASGSPEQLGGLRVLVVDDEPDTLELLSTALARHGAEVTTADSAAVALAVLERSRHDVMLSDIGMPDEDGYALIRKVRALPAERGGRTPAAALTAYAREEDRARALSAGFQAHLPKPVGPAELVSMVASLAGRTLKRMRDEG